MTATIIKFDSLANAVGTAPQNHDPGFSTLGKDLVGFHLVGVRAKAADRLFIGGIIVRSIGLKFRGTGIDPFVNGGHPRFLRWRLTSVSVVCHR